MWSFERWPIRLARARSYGSALLLFSVLLGSPVAAQEAEPPGEPTASVEPAPVQELLLRLESDYRVLKLSRGLVLEPKSDLGGIETIEITAGGYAIDGSPVTARELAARLGPAADLVLELGEMSADERRSLIEEAPTGAMAISEPEAPAVPDEPRAPRPPRRPVRSDDAEVVFGSDLTVGADETTRDVVVFGGDLRIEGKVFGDAASIGGDVWVDGEITGDLAVVGSSAWIGPNAVIHGELVNIGGEIDLDDNAQVDGQVVDVPFGPNLRFNFWPSGAFGGNWWRWTGHDWAVRRPLDRMLELIWEGFCLAILVLLACLALLLARGPVDRIGGRVVAEPWKAGLVGLLAQVLFFPLLVLVVVILTISIIGIPLLLLVPFAVLALILVAFLGYTAVAFRIGGWARRRFGWQLANPYLALLVGIGIVQIWSLLGHGLEIAGGPLRFPAVILMLFGGLLQYVVWTVGFGAAVLTRFGTADRRAAVVPPPPAAPLPPPTEATAPPAESERESLWEERADEPDEPRD